MIEGGKIELSVVVPLFNEESNLDELYKRLTKSIHIFTNNYELNGLLIVKILYCFRQPIASLFSAYSSVRLNQNFRTIK